MAVAYNFSSKGPIAPRLRTVKTVVNPILAQLEAILLRCFFAIKDRPFDAPHLYNRTKATRAKDNALRVQSNPIAKIGTAEPEIRKPLYRSIPHCRVING